MQELEKRIGLLRLLLADIQSKQAQVTEMEDQYKAQLARIVDFVVYREGDVANALSLMSEVQSKLDEVLQTADHLKMVQERARTELDVLVLTKRVAEARSQLAELEGRQQELAQRLSHLPNSGVEVSEATGFEARMDEMNHIQDEVAEVANQIARLNSLITEASDRAARTIQVGKGGAQ
jgi:septal ring factor EnvC (AmiA/AmiB activator)